MSIVRSLVGLSVAAAMLVVPCQQILSPEVTPSAVVNGHSIRGASEELPGHGVNIEPQTFDASDEHRAVHASDAIRVGDGGTKAVGTRKSPSDSEVHFSSQVLTTGDIATGLSGTVEWRIDSDGVLVIGPGTFADDLSASTPWGQYVSQVSAVVIAGPGKTILPPNSRNVFANMPNMVSFTGARLIDTSQVYALSSMFAGASSLKALDLSGWNTGGLEDVYKMFSGASSLQTLDLSGWDTSNLRDMGFMFEKASSLESLDFSGWDTSQVRYMDSMFADASSLTELDLSYFDIGEVDEMSNMFNGASGLTMLDLSNWKMLDEFPSLNMFAGVDRLRVLKIGNETLLPQLPEPDSNSGKWIHIGDGTITKPGIAPWSGTGVELAEFMTKGAGGTYVAQEEVTVTFDANHPEATGSIDPISGLTGQTVTVAGNTFKVEQYSFTGWNTKKDGTGTEYVALKPALFSGGSTVLYAQWKENAQPTGEPSVKPTGKPTNGLANTGSSAGSSFAVVFVLLLAGGALLALSRKQHN